MSHYDPSQQDLVVQRISMPLANIVKDPGNTKWRNVSTTNSLLKPVFLNKKEQVETFMVGIGFVKDKDTVFKY